MKHLAMAVSRHMATLRKAGLVADGRDARCARCRLNPAVPLAVRHLPPAAPALPIREQSLAA
ncbi:MAG: hypothetical protein V4653_02955 [Pseudomonadota bacterium]